jgi:hypothetical protein
MGMGGYGYMPMQQPTSPNMGKGNYYPGMGYLPEARNEIGRDFFGGTSLGAPPATGFTPEPDPRGIPAKGPTGPVAGGSPDPLMSIDDFSKSPLMGPTTMEYRQPVEFEGGMYDPKLVERYQDYVNTGGQGPKAIGGGVESGLTMDPNLARLRPSVDRFPQQLRPQQFPFMGGGYGMPFGGMPFYGGMMQPSPFYGGLGGFLGGGFGGGFGGGPMYGGFRRRFDPYQSMMPQQQEYTPPTQETMTPLLEEFTNFYLDDFQKRNPPTQRSSTMRSTMSPYGIGSLFGGG